MELKPEKDKAAFLCSVCKLQKVKTDGYYHSFEVDRALSICVFCFESGVVWAAQQAYKGKI